MARDPICNMEVDEKTAQFKSNLVWKRNLLFLLGRMQRTI